jgi:hypothetical protein
MTDTELPLLVNIKEEHYVSVWREEPKAKTGFWWHVKYVIENNQLASVHRYIGLMRQGLTEAYVDGRKVAEVVYTGGKYKRIKMYQNGPVVMWSEYLGRPIDITCLVD